MPPKRAGSAGKKELKDGKKNPAKSDEKQQKETKKSPENLRKQIQDLETDKRNLETENLLLKNNFNIQKILKDLETTGGNQDQFMLGLVQEDILAYLRLQIEKLENSSITSNEKPTKSQDNSQMQEKLNAEMEKVKERDQQIVKLDNDIKNLEDKLKTSEDQSRSKERDLEGELETVKRALKITEKELDNVMKKVPDIFSKRHSSEQKKTDDSLKEEQREWEKKYNAEVKNKETAINELNQMRKKVEDLEAEAKKQRLETTTAEKVGEQVPENDEGHSKIKSLEKRLEEKENEIGQLTNMGKQSEEALQSNKSDLSKLNEQITKLTKERDDLNKNIKDMEKTLQTASKDAGLKERYEQLSSELVDVKRKYNELEKENTSLKKSCDENIAKLKQKETKISQMENEKKHLVEEKNKEIEKLQKEKSNADSKHVTSANGNAKGLKEKFDAVNIELKDAKEEISELKNRLSKVVGAKVMDDNPNITDLSDENRPTKLSEKFSELYDNQWTDAYEESENNNTSETDIIRELYKLLIDINEFCQKLAVSHAEIIKFSALSVPSAANGKPKTPQIGVTQTRLLKELRKTFAPYLVDSVFQHFVKTKKIDTNGRPKTEQFVKECVKICWLMNAQDPPVVLDTSNVKGNFDDNRFRTYTKSGKTVDFVVWPPMLLHNDGPLLCKGVAQGK